jgi:DNA-binding transcriptional MerR regulator
MIDEKIIPQKSIFKSSEVCEIVGVKPYILRFWETEFVEICPIISSSGKKLFEKKDILLISVIKDLLFSKKLTLEKAKFEITKIDLNKMYSVKENTIDQAELNQENANSELKVEEINSFNKETVNEEESSQHDELNEVKSADKNVSSELASISSAEKILQETDLKNQIVEEKKNKIYTANFDRTTTSSSDDRLISTELDSSPIGINPHNTDEEDLIHLIPELPINKESKIVCEKTKDAMINDFNPQVSLEKISELNVALESIFEKSKLLKGQYQWF